MDFAAAVAKLDAQADTRLGDSLLYHRAGVISAEPVKGFITDPADLAIADIDTALDQLGQRRRLEISREIISEPTKRDRVESDHRLLRGSVWIPQAWRAYRGGRYWLIELKKAGT